MKGSRERERKRERKGTRLHDQTAVAKIWWKKEKWVWYGVWPLRPLPVTSTSVKKIDTHRILNSICWYVVFMHRTWIITSASSILCLVLLPNRSLSIWSSHFSASALTGTGSGSVTAAASFHKLVFEGADLLEISSMTGAAALPLRVERFCMGGNKEGTDQPRRARVPSEFLLTICEDRVNFLYHFV